MAGRLLLISFVGWLAAAPCDAQRPTAPAAAPTARGGAGDSLLVGAVLGGFIFAGCPPWRAPAPTHGDSVLVDIYFGEVVPARRGRVGPRRGDLTPVRALGGRIVRRFPFRAARVMMPAARVPELARVAAQLQSVPDPRQANWEMMLMYRRKLRPADTAEWRALGGRVRRVFDRVRSIYGSISGVLPDSAVRILSERHWLRAINANTIACVGDGSRR
jgi:hypothetical protein